MNLGVASFWLPDAATFGALAPEFALCAAIVSVLAAPLMLGRDTRLTGLLALAGSLVAAYLAWTAMSAPPPAGELFAAPLPTGEPGPGMFLIDRLSQFFRLFLLLFLAAIIGMWFLLDASRERNAPEFFTLLLASALGMILMAGTLNLLTMLVAIELASLPSYGLAGFDRRRRTAAEASVKYVVFGAAMSGFMIYGVSVLFGVFGTLHIPTLVERIAAAVSAPDAPLHLLPLLGLALLAVFAGVGFKISAVPFHFWCPDVFEGASLTIATWLSVASKAAGLVLLVRLVQFFSAPVDGAYVEGVLPIIAWGVAGFAALTLTVANLAAYQQTNIRRMLAYSSIAHAGAMLCIATIVFPAALSAEAEAAHAAGVSALAQYLFIYLFMNYGAFMALGLVAVDRDSEDIEAFTGLGWRDPAAAASLTLCLISLVGLPPLGGFIAKFWVISALATAAGTSVSSLMWLLILVVVINTLISLFYYARVIRQMYLRGLGAPADPLRGLVGGRLALHLCAAVLLVTGTIGIPLLKRVGDHTAAGVRAAAAKPPPTETARP